LNVIAQRYAGALVDVALEHSQADKVRAELSAFAAVVAESADLRNFLESPAVGREHKQAVVRKVVAKLGSSKWVTNFLQLLVDHRRVALLPQIRVAFDQVLHARMNVAEAEVTTARELTPQERDAINKALEKVLGRRVDARYSLDAELVGGARVQVGSTIYDGTVREQLNRLRARLASE